MRSYANLKSRRLFVSVKCRRAIPSRSPLLRDFLIQSTLDPSITSIDYIPTHIIDGKPVNLNAVVIERDGLRHAVDLVDERPLRTIDDEGMSMIARKSLGLRVMPLRAAQIRAEPRLTNSREIWSHRSTNLIIEDRAAIVDAIEGSGPITIAELRALVKTTRPVATCVFAMACEGELVIDATALLGRQSMVSLGRASRASGDASHSIGCV